MIFLPVFQIVSFYMSIGVNLKYINIAIKNDEVNIVDCKHFKIDECIFEKSDNITMSCVIMNYFESRDYNLVSVFKNFLCVTHKKHSLIKNKKLIEK